MNQLKKQLLCLAVLVNAVPLYGSTANTTTNIVPRSQSFDAARQMVGWDNSIWGINRKADDNRYFTSFNLTFAYTRTFRDNRLTRALFGNDLVCSGCDNDLGINISSSGVASRGATDWLGDYFGLPLNYSGNVTFNPRISNFILDFSLYAGLDAWADGLYFRIHSPFVRTKWNLNAQETTTTATSYDTTYPAGYFASAPVTAAEGVSSFLAYANGATPTFDNYSGSEVIWQPLCCSRIINSCDCDGSGFVRNGFGEIRFVLGRNFFSEKEDRDCHLGVGAYAAAPTGTRVGSSRYLFEPIVGNGKHWELGGQVTAHHIWWKSQDEDRSFGVYMEANITHLFGAQQRRCFDLCSAGSSSRYMLAQKLEYFSPDTIFGGPGEVTLNPQVDTLTLQFANEYAPVANLTRRDVTSTIQAQGDLAISFAYKAGGFQWDLGYNFWGRSCEKLRLSTDCCPVIPGTWALKGTAYVYGFDVVLPAAVPLAASDSNATIHSGTNNILTGVNVINNGPLNQGIDNNVLATDIVPVTLASNNLLIEPVPGSAQTYTSNTPVLIAETDFDFTGTRGISNKLFTNINWAWDHCNDGKWSPYVGLGAEIEFGSNNGGKDCCNNPCSNSCTTSCNTGCTTSCNTGCSTSCNPCTTVTSYPTASTPSCDTLKQCCSNVALTQWGIWFKVGTSYN